MTCFLSPFKALPTLKPGRNRIEFSLAGDVPAAFRVRVDTVKAYR